MKLAHDTDGEGSDKTPLRKTNRGFANANAPGDASPQTAPRAIGGRPFRPRLCVHLGAVAVGDQGSADEALMRFFDRFPAFALAAGGRRMKGGQPPVVEA
ncbi:hypothetical protein ColLi_04910 [Colletotrichum liriopes]|uniref:Uncharacterized protein n=1 Tax=Colletotrichum liriopes TaxID=708192 RepID=A0AA37GJW7_9PEZI|nr:hypothetical protein ColLi_04910 [Colletotrichum liriopes]